MSPQFKVCNCNRTMPLDASSGARLGAALGCGPLPIATELCRRDAGSLLQAMQGVDDVVVGCTQECSLFLELAQQKQSAAPLRFVNLRETGGWGAQANAALPKMAALLAAAALPDAEPVPSVSYTSHGRVLIIGPAERALPWAQRLHEQLEVSLLLTGGSDSEQVPQERLFPIFTGDRVRVAGWLGAFDVRWRQANPIDLETCVRCNACVDACPENAIDLTYQIDMAKCKSHRACVKACGAIGAIDFARSSNDRNGNYDLIFDLAELPSMTLHQLPQGYLAPGRNQMRQIEDTLKLLALVGEFEKPKFFAYKEKLCAHGRNGKIGCTSCIDVCSAEAISHDGDHVKVNSYLCAGCGTCGTVCPSGAMSYAYPRATDLGLRIKTLLHTFVKAGGVDAALLLHGKERGAGLIGQLGRLGKAGGNGVPARVIPVDMHHSASTGIDLWLTAIAYGATNVALLISDEEAPQYRTALEQQIEIGQAILSGLGYAGTHLHLIHANTADELDSALQRLQPAQVPAQSATFNVAPEKRGTLDFVIAHLLKFAPAPADQIALPGGALYGAVTVNRETCTLCMACVGACPESALIDNQDLPQLRFVEKNCVQCGLCEKTCPEGSISLTPRLLLTAAAGQASVLNEAQPYHCIRCNKPFGTLPMIENMLAKLALHGAFEGKPDRLKMCPDCRVIDMMENPNETSISELKRPRN